MRTSFACASWRRSRSRLGNEALSSPESPAETQGGRSGAGEARVRPREEGIDRSRRLRARWWFYRRRKRTLTMTRQLCGLRSTGRPRRTGRARRRPESGWTVPSTWSVFGLKPSGPGVSWSVRSKLCGHDSTRAQDALQPRGFALGGRTQKCRAAIPRSPDGHVQCSSASAAAGASRLTAVRR